MELFRNVLEGKPGKEMELENSCLPWIELGQLRGPRPPQARQQGIRGRRDTLIQGYLKGSGAPLPAPFARA